MIALLRIVVIAFGALLSLMSLLILFRFRWSRGGPILWILKSGTGALSHFLSIAGVMCAVFGIIAGSLPAVVLGGYSAIIFFNYYRGIAALSHAKTGFAASPGQEWGADIPAARKAGFLPTPAAMRLPVVTDFSLKQDILFGTIPDTGRQLLCDLWLPAGNAAPSGLAFIYLHGSAWYYMDKDVGTRPFFQHLAVQGHVVMDVAYRLFPETDMAGMIQDAKRAIAWIKANAPRYGVDPGKIVIGGGSAGGHLALMAAFLPEEEKLSPAELPASDLGVQAVVAFYGPPDLEALYYHTDQQIATKAAPGKPKPKPAPMPPWVRRMMGKDFLRLGMNKPQSDAGSLPAMLGCHPEECPELYAYYSPVTHVGPACPPTLMIHGEHDMFTPVDATRNLYGKLKEAGVPAFLYLLPQTDHAFDLFLPRLSVAAHSAFYVVERFLALMACGKPVEADTKQSLTKAG